MKYIIFLLLFPLLINSQNNNSVKIPVTDFPYIDITVLDNNIYPVPTTWANIDSLILKKNEKESTFFTDKGTLLGKISGSELEVYLEEDKKIKIDKNSCNVDGIPCKIKRKILKYDFAMDFIGMAYYTSDIPYLDYYISRKKGWINYEGRIVTDTSDVDIHGFRNGMAQFKKDKKWGYINRDLKVVIPPTFDEAINYNSNGLARVKNNKYSGFIDKKGKWIYKFDKSKISFLSPFSNGYAVVRSRSNKHGCINSKGKLKIDTIYNHLSNFRKGLAIAKKDGIWGVLKKKKWKPMVEFEELRWGSKDFFLAKKDSKWGVIDLRKRVILPFNYENLKRGNKFLFFRDNKGWGIMNNQLEIVIEPQYESIGGYGDGLFAVRKNKKWGYIDINNRIVIPLVFDSASQFTPYARGFVRVGNKLELIDNQGNFLSTKGWIEYQNKSDKKKISSMLKWSED